MLIICEVMVTFAEAAMDLMKTQIMTSRGMPTTTAKPMNTKHSFEQYVIWQAKNLHDKSNCEVLTRGLSPSHHFNAESFTTFSDMQERQRWT